MSPIKLKFLFATALLFSIVLGSCNMQDEEIQIPERVFGRLEVLKRNLNTDLDLFANSKQKSELYYESNLSFEYQVTGAKEQIKLDASIEKNRLLSVLSYKKDELGWVEASNLAIDLQEGYKGKMNILIEKHAGSLKKKFDLATVSRIANILEGLPELLYNELGRKEFYDESTMSIYYHLAAFNTARRSYESRSRDCQCEVNPNYIGEKSTFFCAEDILINADFAFEITKERLAIKQAEGYQFNPNTLLKYLIQESGQFVAASKIDKLVRDEFDSYWKKLKENERKQFYNNNLTLSMFSTITTRSDSYDGSPMDPFCWIYDVRSGSDCGCCGNYSGACWYCSWICFVHDYGCQTCNRIECFWGCVPEPCANNWNP